MSDVAALLERLDALLTWLEAWLPPAAAGAGRPDWAAAAFRWRAPGLQAVVHPHRLALDDLCHIDYQRHELERNTRQFLAGLPANNALLWGARGTGKSSLVKALLNQYADQGLRLIEVQPQDLKDLPDIVAPLFDRPERFIVFADDLTFAAHDPSYTALKAILDGSIASVPDNVIIYATSNRRHLLPEFQQDNQAAQILEGELHPSEAVEEKISLSERFGLWLSFYPFDQAQFLQLVWHWLRRFAMDPAPAEASGVEQAALQYALRRGSRSGRVAWQFARDWAGQRQLETRS